MPTTLSEHVASAAFAARCARAYKDECDAIAARKRQAVHAERQAEPIETLPTSIGFLRRHPRYWTAEEHDAYESLRIARMQTIATMAHEGHNGGRAAMVRPTNLPQVETVNATEVRYSERWSQDKPSQVKWPTKWDGRCYSITADGRKVFTVASDDTTTPRRATANHDHAGDYARRTALVGIADQPA